MTPVFCYIVASSDVLVESLASHASASKAIRRDTYGLISLLEEKMWATREVAEEGGMLQNTYI